MDYIGVLGPGNLYHPVFGDACINPMPFRGTPQVGTKVGHYLRHPRWEPAGELSLRPPLRGRGEVLASGLRGDQGKLAPGPMHQEFKGAPESELLPHPCVVKGGVRAPRVRSGEDAPLGGHHGDRLVHL